MFIKLYLQPNAFKLFRAEDVISIDPVIDNDDIVHGYKLRLANSQEDIDLTKEQAHDMSSRLRYVSVFHPRQYQ